MPRVDEIMDETALSPALNDRSLGDRLIAIHHSNTVTLFNIYTSHLYAQCWDPGWGMAFIGDGTKLASVRATGAPDSRRILSILQSTIMIQLTSRRILRD